MKKIDVFAGNRSSSYKELGFYAAEDKCCREHDHCPAALAPGECKKSVCNKGRFTRSHCDCDARLRRCLQALNTGINIQKTIEFTYVV